MEPEKRVAVLEAVAAEGPVTAKAIKRKASPPTSSCRHHHRLDVDEFADLWRKSNPSVRSEIVLWIFTSRDAVKLSKDKISVMELFEKWISRERVMEVE